MDGQRDNPHDLASFLAVVPGNSSRISDRTVDELMEAAAAIDPGDKDGIYAILQEAAGMPPLESEEIVRTLAQRTGHSLKALKAQLQKAARDDDKPDDLALAERILHAVGDGNLISVDGACWRWTEAGIWRPLTRQGLDHIVQTELAKLGRPVKAGGVKDVSQVLINHVHREHHEFNKGSAETVNCSNCELSLVDGRWEMFPHRREHFRTSQIPVTYDDSAYAPLFETFLDGIFQGDSDRNEKIQAVLEMLGYTLVTHARHERFILLVGEGANGKSVLLSVVEALCGRDNVAGVPLGQLDRPFQRAHLDHKLANIVTEIAQGQVLADAELKSLVSGEPTTVEHKFQQPFVMRPHATFWVATNHMPHTRDFSPALFRRALVIRFNRVFAPEDQDPDLAEKLRAELAGILNMALKAYARALERGFTEPPSSEAAKHDWRMEADQVAQFVDDECIVEAGAQTAIAVLYARYKQWAEANGIHRTVAMKAFRERLTRLGYGYERTSQARMVTGLRVEGPPF